MIALQQHMIIGRANLVASNFISSRLRSSQSIDYVLNILKPYKDMLALEVDKKAMDERTMLLCVIGDSYGTDEKKLLDYAGRVLTEPAETQQELVQTWQSRLVRLAPYKELGDNTGLQESILKQLDQSMVRPTFEGLEKTLKGIQSQVTGFLQDIETLDAQMI